jgi:Zn-dependent protease/CBS domain-containing protein
MYSKWKPGLWVAQIYRNRHTENAAAGFNRIGYNQAVAQRNVRGTSLRIARIFGIPIYLHPSWFLVFALVTLSLASGFAENNQDWSSPRQWAVGVIGSLLFFGSVLFHELSHSVVALHYRIPVRSITLFIFGGVAQIPRDPERALHEFLIAAAGPFSSALLAGGFFLLQSHSPNGSVAHEVGDWLSLVNLSLAIFNLVPGFPLDGGRILRAILWGATGSYRKATRIASRSGEVIGLLLITAGVAGAVFGRSVGVGVFEGLWTAFIGWFLWNMARQSYAQGEAQGMLGGLTAADVMVPDAPTVPRDLSLQEYSQAVARSNSRTHLVVGDGHLVGLITIGALKAVPESEWSSTSVQAIMLPRERMYWTAPGEAALTLMERMRESNLPQVAVVDGEQIVGLVTLDSISQALQIRSELNRRSKNT